MGRRSGEGIEGAKVETGQFVEIGPRGGEFGASGGEGEQALDRRGRKVVTMLEEMDGQGEFGPSPFDRGLGFSHHADQRQVVLAERMIESVGRGGEALRGGRRERGGDWEIPATTVGEFDGQVLETPGPIGRKGIRVHVCSVWAPTTGHVQSGERLRAIIRDKAGSAT